MLRYIRFYCNTGYHKEEEYSHTDMTDEELDAEANELAQYTAESYDYLARGWGQSWESPEDEEEYYNNLDYGWVEITKEEYEEGM